MHAGCVRHWRPLLRTVLPQRRLPSQAQPHPLTQPPAPAHFQPLTFPQPLTQPLTKAQPQPLTKT